MAVKAARAISIRFDEDMSEALDFVSLRKGSSIADVVRAAMDDYLRENYDGEPAGTLAHDDPGLFDLLPEERKAAVLSYIKQAYMPANEYAETTSYGMKHGKTERAVGYLKNGEFKGAMLAAGYLPKYKLAQNWVFKVADRAPTPEGIYLFVEKKARTASGSVRMFSGDFVYDGRTKGIKTVTDFIIYAARESGCSECTSAFKRIAKEYGDAHPEEKAEFVSFVNDNMLTEILGEHIPDEWRPLVKKGYPRSYAARRKADEAWESIPRMQNYYDFLQDSM